MMTRARHAASCLAIVSGARISPLSKLDALESHHRKLDNQACIRAIYDAPFDHQKLCDAERAVEVERDRHKAGILAGDFAPGEYNETEIRRIFA
jgi:hypothetical protein